MRSTAKTTKRRDSELRAVLEARRQQLTSAVNARMKDVRSRAGDDRDVPATQFDAESDIQDDIDLALIQMRAEMVSRIDAALERLARGDYGDCAACGRPISSQRLAALPFAVRCRTCEEASERSRTAGMDDLQRRSRRGLDLE